MKKIVSIALVLILTLSLCFVPAFAVGAADIIAEQKEAIDNFREAQFSNATSEGVLLVMFSALVELHERGISDEIYQNVLRALDGEFNEDSIKSAAPAQTEYDFGQGTFVVGQDLAAGTYDVTCTSTNDSSYSDSMNAFSDFASSYGMEEYADLFDSYGSLATYLDSMSIMVYKANGTYDNSYTIKPDGSARIIVTDGMKIEITGGNAHLTWIR